MRLGQLIKQSRGGTAQSSSADPGIVLLLAVNLDPARSCHDEASRFNIARLSGGCLFGADQVRIGFLLGVKDH